MKKSILFLTFILSIVSLQSCSRIGVVSDEMDNVNKMLCQYLIENIGINYTYKNFLNDKIKLTDIGGDIIKQETINDATSSSGTILSCNSYKDSDIGGIYLKINGDENIQKLKSDWIWNDFLEEIYIKYMQQKEYQNGLYGKFNTGTITINTLQKGK